jgi:outer membrane beta-barrel protein
MRRFRPLTALLLTGLMVLAFAPATSWAQGKKGGADVPAPPPPTPAPPPTAPPAPDAPPKTPGEGGPAEKSEKKLSPEMRWQEAQKTWKNIVVLPRKSFLKRMRLEVLPFVGTTVNDQMVQHTVLGGELNFFLTDILAIGVRGMYYFDTVMPDEFWTRYHFGRVPTLNRYIFTITGDFSYVPIYGKFTVFNKKIFQYEIFISGGVGVTRSEVIPRDFDNEPFQSWALTFPVGIGGRFFFTKWLAAQASFRYYLLVDRFEATGRTKQIAQEAIDAGETKTEFISNLVFTFGVAVFFPLDFKYTTFR